MPIRNTGINHSMSGIKLPKKIQPDRIKEAVVEIRYTSHLPFEILLGILFNAFDNSYNYTNRPLKNTSFGEFPPRGNPGEIAINIGVLSIFYNDKVSIQIRPNSFVFTCLNEYI